MKVLPISAVGRWACFDDKLAQHGVRSRCPCGLAGPPENTFKQQKDANDTPTKKCPYTSKQKKTETHDTLTRNNAAFRGDRSRLVSLLDVPPAPPFTTCSCRPFCCAGHLERRRVAPRGFHRQKIPIKKLTNHNTAGPKSHSCLPLLKYFAMRGGDATLCEIYRKARHGAIPFSFFSSSSTCTRHLWVLSWRTRSAVSSYSQHARQRQNKKRSKAGGRGNFQWLRQQQS